MFKSKQEIIKYLNEKLKDDEKYSVSLESEKDYLNDLKNVREGIIKSYPKYKEKLIEIDLEEFRDLDEIYQQELESRSRNSYNESIKLFLEIHGII